MLNKSELILNYMGDNKYRCIFKTTHSRAVYMEIIIKDDKYIISECFYADRDISLGNRSYPSKLKSRQGRLKNLLYLIEDELDKKFYSVSYNLQISNSTIDEYILSFNEQYFKYKFLILVKKENKFMTRFKNRSHRAINIEMEVNDNNLTIVNCCYYDRNYVRSDAAVAPAKLLTISFGFTPDNILNLFNNELFGDFTDVLIVDDTFGFENRSEPICGCI